MVGLGGTGINVSCCRCCGGVGCERPEINSERGGAERGLGCDEMERDVTMGFVLALLLLSVDE